MADGVGRHRRIAYRGNWIRAIRRSAWVGIIVMVFVVLRLQGLLVLPIALFMIALVVVAEATLSAERSTGVDGFPPSERRPARCYHRRRAPLDDGSKPAAS